MSAHNQFRSFFFTFGRVFEGCVMGRLSLDAICRLAEVWSYTPAQRLISLRLVIETTRNVCGSLFFCPLPSATDKTEI